MLLALIIVYENSAMIGDEYGYLNPLDSAIGIQGKHGRSQIKQHESPSWHIEYLLYR